MNKAVDLIERACTSLGNKNKSTYAVMAIAFVKGICRPAFTMMDKTENPETKKYTALREGLTELIAIPTYFFCGEAAAALSKLFPEKMRTNANTNLMFLGVCAAALIAIPALCNVALKPVMNKIQKNNTAEKQPVPIPLYNNIKENRHNCYNNYDRLNTFSSRMPYSYKLNCRIGGI